VPLIVTSVTVRVVTINTRKRRSTRKRKNTRKTKSTRRGIATIATVTVGQGAVIVIDVVVGRGVVTVIAIDVPVDLGVAIVAHRFQTRRKDLAMTTTTMTTRAPRKPVAKFFAKLDTKRAPAPAVSTSTATPRPISDKKTPSSAAPFAA
jgi:hypothetical protein